MKKSTVVLTAATLAASLLGLSKPGAAQTSSAQSLAALTGKGYDATLASNSLAANSDANAMLVAVNAVRKSNGLPTLAVDASLSAATMYQETCELQHYYVGNYGLVNGGATKVTPAQMAADFNSAATNVQEYAFGNGFFPGDTDNWPALMNDWQQHDAGFAAMLNDPSVNVAGINLVDTGDSVNGAHIYKWSLMVGYVPTAGATQKATSSAQSLVALTGKGYDATLASNSLAANSDANAMLVAVNAVRKSNGLPTLAVDASLSAATMYQETCELQHYYVGNYGLVNGGATKVTPAQMAADFNSAATNVQEYAFGNGFFPGDTDNWPALMNDWQQHDAGFAAMLNDPSVNVAGINLVDTGDSVNGAHIYKWSLMVGYNPKATIATGPTGPTVNLGGLNAALAAKAQAAKPTQDETNFLAAINAYRASLGVQPLRTETSLYSAAYYKGNNGGQGDASTLATDFGSQHITYISASNSTSSLFYGYLLGYYGDWTDISGLWASYGGSTSQTVFSDGSYSHAGLSIVDAGTQAISPLDGVSYEVYNWTIILGR